MQENVALPPSLSPFREYDQVVKGNVTIKKISKHKYRITFSKIGKFLVYQIWDKDNAGNLNSNRFVNYLSAKNWVTLFNNEPLFTPTTVIEMEDSNYTFVIHKAYMNSCGHVVFTVSTKEIKLESNNTSSKNLIKIPCGKFNNVRFDIDASSRKTSDPAYNVSDCGFPNVRSYCCGGNGPGSACGRWLDDAWLNIIWKTIPDGELTGRPMSEIGFPPYDYNWLGWDILNGSYTDPKPELYFIRDKKKITNGAINIDMTGDLVLNYSIDLANYVAYGINGALGISYELSNIKIVGEVIPEDKINKYVFLDVSTVTGVPSILRILFGVKGSCTLTVRQKGITPIEISINFFYLYFNPDKITNGVINISITGDLAENYSIDLANYVVGDKALDISYELTNIILVDEDIPDTMRSKYVFLEGSILRILFKVQGSCTLTVRQKNLVEIRITLQFK